MVIESQQAIGVRAQFKQKNRKPTIQNLGLNSV
jgi:hypothetical protein